MPAADRIHQTVKNALIKSGWAITDDPFTIEYEDILLFADLGAERPIGVRRGETKIVVEVKSFQQPSLMREFELALGQYLIYRVFLAETAPEWALYLAVDHLVFSAFFQHPAIKKLVDVFEIRFVVINLDREEILQWTS